MTDKPIKILLIEDNPADVELVKEMIYDVKSVQFEFSHFDKLGPALDFLSNRSVDIILLDLSLPDAHGIDTVIRTRTVLPGIPIVVMSGLGDEETAIKAVHEGAQDYLVKGQVDSSLLVRSVLYSIERKRAEEALRKLNDELEMRVQQRTEELLKMNRALQESERKYRMLIEQASDGIFILDDLGNIADINSTACQMLGFTREELLLLNIRELIPAKDLAAVPLRINDVLAGEKVVIERRFRRKDNTFVNVEVSANILNDGRVQTIVRDLTERRKADEALRMSKASLAMAQRIAHVGSWDWDIQTKELIWSDEIYRILGLTPGQSVVTYDALVNSVHPEDREFMKKALTEALYGKPYSIEHRIVLPDGSIRVVHEQGKVTFGESGEPVRMHGTVQDITDKKEKELRLHMTEKLAALGQMASGIAHEINNPLATIGACSDGLLNRLKKGRFDDELFESYLKIINEEVVRCKGITTSMLSFVREATYERKDVDIHSILDNTLELITLQGRLKDIEVIKNYEGMLIVRGSEGELRQVILTIIVNALDAMRDRGALTLSTGIIPYSPIAPDGFENYEEKDGDRGVFIKICDTGPGVPSDITGRIFDPFFTTKSTEGGVGLGLSIAHKIIKDHGGTITVASGKDRGTVFEIILPA